MTFLSLSGGLAGGNRAPTWVPINLSFDEGTVLNVDLDSYLTDLDGDAVTYTAVGMAGGLSLSGARGETISGTLTATTSFLVVADDGQATESITANIIAVPVGSTGQQFSYIGAPYVTDPVPSQLYPGLPTGADFTNHEWINTYDPAAIETPSPTGAPNEYVVAYNGNNGSAGNGGQGTLAAPRLTLNGGTYPAGTKIFFVGNPSASGETPQFDMGNVVWTLTGSSSSQCWIVGIDNPRIAADRFDLTNCTHLIIDGIWGVPEGGGGNNFRMRMTGGGNRYTTIRNCDLRGDPNRGDTSAGVVLDTSGQVASRNQFTLVYNSRIGRGGNWSTGGNNPDYHGIRAGGACDWLYIVQNEVYELRGNGCQVGNSPPTQSDPNDDVSTLAGYYYYILGNTWRNTREVNLGTKYGVHVIVVGNDFSTAGGSFTNANQSTLYLATIDGEGKYGNDGNRWTLFNHFHDGTSHCIRMAHRNEDVDEVGYAIGNYATDMSGPFLISEGAAQGSGSIVRGALFNTMVRCGSVMSANTGGADPQVTVDMWGNVSWDCGADHYTYNFHASGDPCNYNVMGNPGGGGTISGSFSGTGNLQSTDPLLNASGGLEAGSPAIGLAPEHPAFQLFQDRYGLDIRFDYNGNARPTSGNWDAGAFQRV